MNPTRSTLARRLLGLAAAPALLVGLAACGDDDSAGGAFCDGVTDVDSELADADVSSPGSEGFAEAAAAMRELDPPAEIADDWDTMVSAFEALASVDASDPDAADQAAQFQDAEQAITNVGTYLEDECGLEGF